MFRIQSLWSWTPRWIHSVRLRRLPHITSSLYFHNVTRAQFLMSIFLAFIIFQYLNSILAPLLVCVFRYSILYEFAKHTLDWSSFKTFVILVWGYSISKNFLPISFKIFLEVNCQKSFSTNYHRSQTVNISNLSLKYVY